MSTTALIPNQASRVSHPYQHALLDRVNQLLPQEGVITTAIARPLAVFPHRLLACVSTLIRLWLLNWYKACLRLSH